MTSPVLNADIQLIQRILPHRYPFLLVDKVLEIDGYKSAIGIKNVSMNEPHFKAIFPVHPLCPALPLSRQWRRPRGLW